jgi:beta-lactamase class A
MKLGTLLVLVLSGATGGCVDSASSGPSRQATWVAHLQTATERIDQGMPGNFGVYVKRLGDRTSFDRQGAKRWYLSSTTKVPLAIAVMEKVDRGDIQLEEKLTLKQTDFVDGSGDLIWQEPGGQYTIAELIEKSLQNSDSTATDMLIRRIGEKELNDREQAWTGEGFGRITTIIQVRYDVYGVLHPGVARLTNTQIISLRNAEAGEPRLQALAKTLGVPRGDLKATSLESVFENYYQRGDNSATLVAFGTLLEKLLAGELLSEASTERVLNHMRKITTGERRIMAGLPEGVDFAQKTGTQIGRACNVGVMNTAATERDALIIVSCAEQFDELAQAEKAFQQFGAALVSAGLLAR